MAVAVPRRAVAAAALLLAASCARARAEGTSLSTAALSPFSAPTQCIGTIAGSAPAAAIPGKDCPNDGASVVAVAASPAGVLYASTLTFLVAPGSSAWLWRGQVRATALDGSCVVVAGVDTFLDVPSFGGSGSARPPGSPPPACALGVGPLPASGEDARSVCLQWPSGLTVDPTTGDVMIVDAFAHRVLRLAAATGRLTTLAGSGTPGYAGDGGPAATAQLFKPTAVAPDFSEPGAFFIADSWNSVVRRVSAAGGISTVAGSEPTDGTGYAGTYASSMGAPFPNNGPTGYGCMWRPAAQPNDVNGNVISPPMPTTFGDAGAGPARRACLQSLGVYHAPSLAGTPDGGFVYADAGNNRVLKFTPAAATAATAGGSDGYKNYSFSTIAGSAEQWQDTVSISLILQGGQRSSQHISSFLPCYPQVANLLDPSIGNIYPSCDDNSTSRIATSACFCSPRGIAVEASGAVVVTDFDTRTLAATFVDLAAAATRVRRIFPNGTAVTLSTPPGVLSWIPQSPITYTYGDVFPSDVRVLSGGGNASVAMLTATGIPASAVTP